MKKIMLGLLVLMSVSASAATLGMVEVKTKNVTLSYPVLSGDSSAALKAVNNAIKKTVKQWKAGVDSTCTLDVTSTIDAFNQRYLSFHSAVSSYCEGGAHADRSFEGHVYDLNTGQEVILEEQFNGIPNFSDYLAEAIPSRLVDECFSGSVEENIKLIDTFSVILLGVKNDELYLTVEPPYMESACGFMSSIPLKEIGTVLKTDSILKTWLK